MPYRLASNAVWHSLPGVVSAYQPIGAPDAIAARQNIGLWQRLLGSYTAAVGVAEWPVLFNSRAGWGTSTIGPRYIMTTIVPNAGWSALIRFSDVITNASFFGALTIVPALAYFAIDCAGVGNRLRFLYGASVYLSATAAITSGVVGIAGSVGYKNGISDTALGAFANINTTAMPISARSIDGTKGDYQTENIQAFVVYSRTLTPAEGWLASMQMAYCDVNPEWNAWAPRRRYWIAPAAGGAVGIYGRRHELRIPGGVRIEATK